VAREGKEGKLPLDVKIEKWTPEDVQRELDMDSQACRWIMKQVTSYDPERQYILGIVFSRELALTSVLERRRSA
jgi:hypothetical protein